MEKALLGERVKPGDLRTGDILLGCVHDWYKYAEPYRDYKVRIDSITHSGTYWTVKSTVHNDDGSPLLEESDIDTKFEDRHGFMVQLPRANASEVAQVTKGNDRFPHTCLICGRRAYLGMTTEHEDGRDCK